MRKKKRSWIEKLHASQEYEVKPAPGAFAGMQRGQIMLVPSASIVDEFIRTIPAGVSMDVKTLRQELAQKYGAEVTCPITMGFHLRTVAEAAFEAYIQGMEVEQITPIWRVLDQQTPTTRRLSYDPAFLLEQRAEEGIAPQT